MAVTLHHGDCLEVLRAMPADSVDSVVTDPPYGLSFMGRKWDYDVPSVEIWAECLRVLKPGGHLLAFAGTRRVRGSWPPSPQPAPAGFFTPKRKPAGCEARRANVLRQEFGAPNQLASSSVAHTS